MTLAAQQGQPADPKRTPGVQGPADPNRAAFLAASCKNAPAPTAARGGGGAPAAPAFQDVASTEIPGVIAAGQHWKVIWEDKGNNADGIVAFDDGSVWVAQNDKSDVVRVDKDGKASVIYTDTYTGGSIAANSKGQVFIGERALGNAIWTLKPERKLFANMYNGEPLDCVAGIINDMSADSKGGVYMTAGGVFYANPNGVIMGRYGAVGGNGIILSPDEKTLYVTGRVGGNAGGARGGAPGAGARGAGASPAGGGRGGGGNNGGLVAFDVQPDGSLTNERQFAETCGDGSTVDGAGRIYCTGGRMTDPADPTKTISGIGVISPKGEILGVFTGSSGGRHAHCRPASHCEEHVPESGGRRRCRRVYLENRNERSCQPTLDPAGRPGDRRTPHLQRQRRSRVLLNRRCRSTDGHDFLMKTYADLPANPTLIR
jgi:sugar lactone lactonase YvrE